MICPCCKSQLAIYRKSIQWIYLRCVVCGFWTTRTLLGEYPQFVYEDSPTFDRNAERDWSTLLEEAKIILKKKFQIVQARRGRFLDYGCSEGVYVTACADLGWESMGYDIDKVKVRRAQDRGLNVSSPDGSNIQSGSLDFVLIRHVLEHVPNFIDIIVACANMLNTGGYVCVELPNQAGFYSRMTRRSIKQGRFLVNLYPPTHIHAFEPRTMAFLAMRSGLICNKVLTYSVANSDWSFSTSYSKRGLKPLLHNLAASVGMGENICAFMTRA